MLLYYAIATLHIIVCIILVLVVLLQSGKGADLAGAFGGGATQTAFGSRGPASFLSKMTTVAAVIFMVTCVALSIFSNRTIASENKSIMDNSKQQQTEAPAQKNAAEKGKGTAPMTREQIKKIQEEYEAKKQQAAQSPATDQQKKPAEKPAESKQPAK